LKSKTLAREISFSSQKQIQDLRVEQYVYFYGEITESFTFRFGFCMPESTNTWQNIIEVNENVLSADMLSKNVVLVTKFFANEIEVSSVGIRILYTKS